MSVVQAIRPKIGSDFLIRSLAAELVAARESIAEDRRSIVECATLMGADGTPDMATLDPDTKPAVDRLDAQLTRIDVVLAQAGQGA